MLSALFASLVVSSNAVTFTATATGIATNAPVEFVFAQAGTDRDYETLFLTDEPISEIVAACDRALIPRGAPYDVNKCVFWAEGPVVTLKPALPTLLRDTRGREFARLVYTGGNGDCGQMPRSFFSTYDLGQSAVRFDENLGQSAEYGRFIPVREFKKGERLEFTLQWDGRSYAVAMTPDFPGDKTVAEAQALAARLAAADSERAKINGFRPGQFYYRAFLPLEKWRQRSERLTQPLEVRLTDSGAVYTLVDEDWSGEGDTPRLTERTVSEAEALQPGRQDTCFFFVSGTTRLSALYELKAKMPANIHNFYVFVD